MLAERSRSQPSLPPNLRNAMLYLLLKDGNQLLVGIDQCLLFFDFGYDLALGFCLGIPLPIGIVQNCFYKDKSIWLIMSGNG